MRVIATGGSFFEAPRWHHGRWWISDFFREAVYSFGPEGEDGREEFSVPGRPSGLGWDTDGRLLVVSMLDNRLLRQNRPDGPLEQMADLSALAGGPSNDMVVDRSGRAWVGDFGFDLHGGAPPATTALARVDPDGQVSEAAGELFFPNGSVVTADGSTLIVGETFASRYTAFTIEADGTLTDRRPWAHLPGAYPDGCCLDADGRIWSADAAGHRCVLVEEGGRVVREVVPPDGLRAFACMLGGEEGTTLLLCCCPDGRPEETARRRDGVLVTIEVDAPHAGLP